MATTVRTKALPSLRGVQAHEFGRCLLSYSAQLNLCVSGGVAADGDVGLHLTKIDDSGNLARLMDVEIGKDLLPNICTAVAVSHDGELVVAADKASCDVRLYTLPSLTFVGNMTRSTLPTRAVAFSVDDKLVACGGDDAVVRVVQRETPTEGAFDLQVGSFIKGIAFDPLGKYLAVSTQDGSLSVFSVAADESRGLITRLTGMKTPTSSTPDRYHDTEFPIAWHPSGAVLAIASDAGVAIVARDTWETVYSPRSPGALPHVMDGYTGTCALVWSPNGRYIAALDGRRLLTVWDVTVAAVDPLTGSAFARDEQGTCDVAVAMYGYCRTVNPEGDAEDAATLSATASAAPTAPAVAASPRPVGIVWTADGDHLAYLDLDGKLGMARVRALSKHNSPEVSTATEPVTAAIDWPMRTAPVKATKRPSATASSGRDAERAPAEAEAVQSSYVDGEAAESDADDAAQTSHAEAADKAPAQSPAAPDPDVPDFSISATKRRFGFVDAEEEGDDGVGGLRSIDDVPGTGGGVTLNASSIQDIIEQGNLVTLSMLQQHMMSTAKLVQEVYGLAPAQLAFTPGSTPFRKVARAHQAQRRYLTWNAVGAVMTRREALNNVVSVEFADTSRHRSFNMTDTLGFTTAALSHGGLMLASPYRPPSSDGDAGTPSALVFRPFGGTLDGSEWRFDLPVVDASTPMHKFPARQAAVGDSAHSKRGRHGAASGTSARNADDPMEEDLDDDFIDADETDETAFEMDEVSNVDTSAAAESALCVSIGDGWCAAATDRQFLRFFRFGGVQDAVIALPGPVVTTAGAGALCAVAYHSSMPSAHTQHITVDIYMLKCSVDGLPSAEDGSRPRKIASVSLPLRARATMQWLAFAENGSLLMHDSFGMMYGLQPGLDWAWTPVCDTRAAALRAAEASGKGGRSDRHTQLWPVAVIRAPASVSMDAEAGEPLVGKRDSQTLTLMAVPVKDGARRFPPASATRPVPSYLKLRIPLLEVDSAAGAFDEAILRHELAYKQAAWANAMGLSPANLVAVSLSAATEAAAAALRGDYGSDAVNRIATLKADGVASARGDAAAIDKALLRAIHAACEEGNDARAVALGSRLHLEKSFEVAVRLITSAGRASTAERLSQFLLLRAAEASAEDPVTTAATAELLARAQAMAASGTTSNGASSTGQRFGLGTSGQGSGKQLPGLGEVRPVTATSTGGLAALKARVASAHAENAGTRGAYGDDASTQDAAPETGRVPLNPFGKRNAALDSNVPQETGARGSPQRKKARDAGLQGLMMASPDRPAGPALNRQSSYAVEARAKRAERA